MTALDSTESDALVITDVSSIPDEPPAGIIYRHKVRFVESIRALWAHREIIYTLAERDFRAQYKQATLGVLWAVLSPLAMLAIFVVVFSQVKALVIPGVPYALYSFVGILCWGFFAAALGTGGQLAAHQQGPAGQDPVPTGVLPPRDHAGRRAEHGHLVDPADHPVRHLRPGPGRHHGVGTPVHGDRGGLRRRDHPGHLQHHHPDARPAPGASADHLARPVRHPGDLAVLEDPDAPITSAVAPSFTR